MSQPAAAPSVPASPPVQRAGGGWDWLLDAPAARPFLFVPWLAWRPLVGIRNGLFDLGWRRPRRLPAPVVSVGNLTMGGTGKTPLIAWLARALLDRGKRVAVLSRGYHADPTTGRNEEAELVPCPVVCNASRLAGGREALRAGATLLLLDDGFQHRQLHRDRDIVCIDATRPWGRPGNQRGFTFPLGHLREPPSALRRADVIVLTRTDQVPPDALDRLMTHLRRLDRPLCRTRHAPQAVEPLLGDDPATDPACLRGTPVVLVSGIAHPLAFQRTVADCGARIIAAYAFPDHHHFGHGDLDTAFATADAAGARVLVTAKDAPKLRRVLTTTAAERIAVLTTGIAFVDQDDAMLMERLRHVGV